MTHDTDVRPGTTTGIKAIIPLNNHLNMTNAMMQLMALSASCDRKHAIGI